VTTNIASPGDAASLTFSATANQSIVLVTQPDSAFFDAGYQVSIIAPDGVSTIYGRFENSGADDSGVWTLPTDGTYTIQFSPAGAVTGNVVMQLETPLTGTITPGGPSVTTSITLLGDAQLLTFAGTVGQQVELLSQPDPAFGAGLGYYAALDAPDGTVLYWNEPHSSPDDSGVVTLPATGTYTVVFSPFIATTGTVSLTLFSAGNQADGANAYTATIATAGTTAQQSFSGVAGSVVSLLTQADTNLRLACFVVSILEPDGQTQLYSNSQASPTDFAQGLVLPTTGTYTISLASCGSATGSAALTLYAVPAPAPGSTTIGGTPSTVTTVVPSQAARVTFATTAANQTANVAVTGDDSFASVCYAVTVTDPGGAVVNTGQNCGTSYSTGVLTLGAAGTYAVTVGSVGTATGNVTVGVTAQ
jgi:hypothetical protein